MCLSIVILFLFNFSLPFPERKLTCISPRVFGHRYETEHLSAAATTIEITATTESPATIDSFLIITNKDNAKNNKLMRVGIKDVSGINIYVHLQCVCKHLKMSSVYSYIFPMNIFMDIYEIHV
jgi:hypothetical protein